MSGVNSITISQNVDGAVVPCASCKNDAHYTALVHGKSGGEPLVSFHCCDCVLTITTDVVRHSERRRVARETASRWTDPGCSREG